MSFAVVAGVGGAIVGGAIAADGAKGAAKTQAKAAQAANQVDLDIFNKQTELQEPFRQNGLAATNRLAFLLGLQPQQGSTQGTAGAPVPLSQGSDGVFAPHAEIPQSAESADAIAARLRPQAQKGGSFGAEDRARLDQLVQAELQRQQQQAMPRQQQSSQQVLQQQPGSSPAANDMTGFGSLNQAFSQNDFAADGAPKIDPFTNPNALPTFDQQAPQVAQFDQWRGAQGLGTYNDRPDLSGFEDMPAFDASMMNDDPGYQFRRDEGLKGIDRTAAAHGGALSGAAVKAAQRFAQDYASNEYGNSFNRYQTTRGNKLQTYLTNQNTSQTNRNNALQAYTTNRDTLQLNNTNELAGYNTNLGVQQANYANQRGAYDANFNQAQVNRTNAVNDNKDAMGVYSLNRNNAMQDYSAAYDRFQTNRSNVMNPLLSIMGSGQQATNQQSAAAQNYGAQSSAAIQAAGNARAAGQVGSANAVTGAIGSGYNAYQSNQLMNMLRQPGTGPSSLFSNTALGSAGFGTGLAYGNQDYGQYF